MNTESIEVLGRTAHVVLQGTGLQPVLLVHGFPLDHQMWGGQLKALSNRYHLICPDLPGFGRSQPLAADTAPAESLASDPASTKPLTMPVLADWLKALLDSLGMQHPVIFCGLSMGGYIGWEFARRHPQRLAAIVACNTRAGNDTETIRRARLMAARDVFNAGVDSVAQAMIPKLFGDAQRSAGSAGPTLSRQRELIHQVIASTDANSIAAGHLGMAAREDATAWLPEIEVPCLFMAGEFDEITPPDEMQRDSQLVPDSEFICLPDSSHLAPLENSSQFNAALDDWLNPRLSD